MANEILQVNNITMQFGGVVAVNDFSLKVNENEIVSIIGPNGAGKTTAFNTITGVYEPTSGEIKFYDEVIVSNHPQGKMKKLYAGSNTNFPNKIVSLTPDKITKKGIARTFQNIRLFKNLTVLDNVLIGKFLHIKSNFIIDSLGINRKEKNRIQEESVALLKLLKLDDVINEKACNLPYGKQRHLEIARALATNPKLLLLDEPAAGMNPQETKELTDFIRYVRDTFKVAILMIEHHMNLVMDISDRIYVLNFGKLISVGTPNEVQNDEEVIKAYLGGTEDVG